MGLDKSQYCTYENVFRDEKYRLIVLDMDGTLYFQRKMQFLMCLEMLFFAFTHPLEIWKLRAISVFRKVRECVGEVQEETADNSALNVHYEKTAQAMGKTGCEIQAVIEEWMFKRPLKYIDSCRDERLCERINNWKKQGIRVVVYSDYPAKDKCEALSLQPDAVYSSEDERISHMKPSAKALQVIAEDFGIGYDEMLIIGDRYSRDGKMAENAGADYLILEKWKYKRNKKWK